MVVTRAVLITSSQVRYNRNVRGCKDVRFLLSV